MLSMLEENWAGVAFEAEVETLLDEFKVVFDPGTALKLEAVDTELVVMDKTPVEPLVKLCAEAVEVIAVGDDTDDVEVSAE